MSFRHALLGFTQIIAISLYNVDALASEPIVLEVDLSENQISQIIQINEQANDDLDPIYQQWNTAQEELETLIVSETASDEDVRQQYLEVESLRAEAVRLEIEKRIAIRRILRPDKRLPYERFIRQRQSQNQSASQ